MRVLYKYLKKLFIWNVYIKPIHEVKKANFFLFLVRDEKELIGDVRKIQTAVPLPFRWQPFDPWERLSYLFPHLFFFLFPNTRRIDNLIQDSALQGGGFTVPWGFLSHPLFPQTKLTSTVTSLKKSSSVLFLFLPHQWIVASMVCPKTQWI